MGVMYKKARIVRLRTIARLLALALVVNVHGCGLGSEIRIQAKGTESGIFHITVRKNRIGFTGSWIPAQGSDLYQYYEANVQNLFDHHQALKRCKVVQESLRFYESGNYVTVIAKCDELSVEGVSLVSRESEYQGKVRQYSVSDDLSPFPPNKHNK